MIPPAYKAATRISALAGEQAPVEDTSGDVHFRCVAAQPCHDTAVSAVAVDVAMDNDAYYAVGDVCGATWLGHKSCSELP